MQIDVRRVLYHFVVTILIILTAAMTAWTVHTFGQWVPGKVVVILDLGLWLIAGVTLVIVSIEFLALLTLAARKNIRKALH